MAFLFWRKEESGRVISYLLNKVLREVNGGVAVNCSEE